MKDRYIKHILIITLLITILTSSVAYANDNGEHLHISRNNMYLEYKINDLKIIDNILSFNFKIYEDKSIGVDTVKVVVKDDKGNIITDTPQDSEGYYTEKIVYKADINNNDTKLINIKVYVFSDDSNFEFLDEVNMDEVPSNETTIDISNIKENTKHNWQIKVTGKKLINKNIVYITIILLLGFIYIIFRRKKNNGR